MALIYISADRSDDGLIPFGDFCELIRTPQEAVRDWRRRGRGPRCTQRPGVEERFATVADARRFLASVVTPGMEERPHV